MISNILLECNYQVYHILYVCNVIFGLWRGEQPELVVIGTQHSVSNSSNYM